MSSACSFIFMQIEVIFHKNGFALRLALKQWHRRTRKWPIRNELKIPNSKRIISIPQPQADAKPILDVPNRFIAPTLTLLV